MIEYKGYAITLGNTGYWVTLSLHLSIWFPTIESVKQFINMENV